MENYQTISNASAQNELESDEFAVTFDNLCSNGNIMALILQQDGKVLRSSVNDLDALRTEFWDVLLHGDKMEVLYSNKQYQLLQKTDTRLDSEYLVLVGVLENGDMVLMRTAVESIRESAAISNRFLLFAGDKNAAGTGRFDPSRLYSILEFRRKKGVFRRSPVFQNRAGGGFLRPWH